MGSHTPYPFPRSYMLMLRLPIPGPLGPMSKTAGERSLSPALVPLAAAVSPYLGGLAGGLASEDMDPFVSAAAIQSAAQSGGNLGAPIGAVGGAGIGAAVGAISHMLKERERAQALADTKWYQFKQRRELRDAEQPLSLQGVMPHALAGASIGGMAGVPVGRALGAHTMRNRAETKGRELMERGRQDMHPETAMMRQRIQGR